MSRNRHIDGDTYNISGFLVSTKLQTKRVKIYDISAINQETIQVLLAHILIFLKEWNIWIRTFIKHSYLMKNN